MLISFDRYNSFLISRNYSGYVPKFSNDTFKVVFSEYIRSQVDFNIVTMFDEKRKFIEYAETCKFLDGKSKNDSFLTKTLLYFMQDVGMSLLHASTGKFGETLGNFEVILDVPLLQHETTTLLNLRKSCINVLSDNVLLEIEDDLVRFLEGREVYIHKNILENVFLDTGKSKLSLYSKEMLSKRAFLLGLLYIFLYNANIVGTVR